MAQQDINIGTEDAKEGDTLFTAFTKIQENFTENYDDIDGLSTSVGNIASDVSDLNVKSDELAGISPVSPAGGVFVSDGSGGGEFIRVNGWGQFVDTDTVSGAPSQTISTTTRTKWTNDGGSLTIQKSPSDLTAPLWDTTNNKVAPISLYDKYTIRVEFSAENYAGSSPYIVIDLDVGGTVGIIAEKTIPLLKSGSTQAVAFSLPLYSGSDFMANGCSIYLTYVGTGSCEIFGSGVFISRDSKNYT